MANALTLIISSVSLSAVGIEVDEGATPHELTGAMLEVKKLNGSTFDSMVLDTNYTFVYDGVGTGTGTITFTPALTESDLILVRIVDSGSSKNSDRVSIDFASTYTAHESTTKVQLPSEAGAYTLNTQTVNGDNFVISSTSFNVGKAPDTANSTIALVDAKPYLVKFTERVMDVTITLNNATSDASEGPYEVVYDIDLA